MDSKLLNIEKIFSTDLLFDLEPTTVLRGDQLIWKPAQKTLCMTRHFGQLGNVVKFNRPSCPDDKLLVDFINREQFKQFAAGLAATVHLQAIPINTQTDHVAYQFV